MKTLDLPEGHYPDYKEWVVTTIFPHNELHYYEVVQFTGYYEPWEVIEIYNVSAKEDLVTLVRSGTRSPRMLSFMNDDLADKICESQKDVMEEDSQVQQMFNIGYNEGLMKALDIINKEFRDDNE